MWIGLDEIQPRQRVFDHADMGITDPFVQPGAAHGDAERITAHGRHVIHGDCATRIQSGQVDRGVERIATEGLHDRGTRFTAHLDHAFPHQRHLQRAGEAGLRAMVKR
ncbi:hypothetical protein D3C76_1023770 [compost metagenome]